MSDKPPLSRTKRLLRQAKWTCLLAALLPHLLLGAELMTQLLHSRVVLGTTGTKWLEWAMLSGFAALTLGTVLEGADEPLPGEPWRLQRCSVMLLIAYWLICLAGVSLPVF